MKNIKFFFSHKLLVFCTQLTKKILNCDQSTSSVIFHYLRAEGKNFGPKERKLITDISFSIVRNKSYFSSLIDEEKRIQPQLDFLRCMVILGTVSKLKRELILPFLTFDEKIFLKNIKFNSVKELYIKFRNTSEISKKLSLPLWIFDNWIKQRGIKKTLEFIESNHSDAPIYGRVNYLQIRVEDAIKKIRKYGYVVEQSILIPECLKFLPGENINVIKSLFSDGEIEIQDLGSQLIVKLLAPKRNEMIIDFCAGTGGKALASAVQMKNSGRVMAFDINAKKILQLNSRVSLSKLKNIWPIVITGLDDERLQRFTGKADAILVDAPCSGLGTLRRNPDLKWKISEVDIESFKINQLSILNKAASLCKAKGRLVYATCSTFYDENEGVVEQFLLNNPQFERYDNNLVLEKQRIILDKAWNVYDSYGNIHLWSDLTDTDCFFMTGFIRIK